jgi:uncharacterized RDD family membrane protein YckC
LTETAKTDRIPPSPAAPGLAARAADRSTPPPIRRGGRPGRLLRAAVAVLLSFGPASRAQLVPAATRPAAAAAPVPRPLAASPDLLAVGPASPGVDLLWVARVIVRPPSALSPGGVQTRIFVRPNGGRFGPLGAGPQGVNGIQGRAVAVAPMGGDLAVLLDDGDWLIQSETGSALGRAFPVRDGRLVTFAADADGLYALALVPGGGDRVRAAAALAAATRPGPATASSGATAAATGAASVPATGQASPSTGPATNPATATTPATAPATSRPAADAGPPATLVLLAYRDSRWQPLADLPPDVARAIDPVSLTLQDRTPFVLVRESPESVRLWRLDGRDWSAVGQAAVSPTTRWVQLVHGGPRPTALVTPASSADADRVLVFDPGRGAGPATASAATRPAAGAPSPAIDLRLDATVGTAPGARAAAYAAAGPFRLLTLADDRLKEQAYDRLTLVPLGGAVTTSVQDPGYPVAAIVLYAVLATAMGFAVVASVRRRNQPRATSIDPADLPLAPLGLRLLAGLIDAVPLVAAEFYSVLRIGAGQRPPPGDLGMALDPWVLSAVGVYLLYMTLVETLAGRSLGKRLCGLRVVSLDGTKPTRGQLATRNLLRVIDVGLQYFPLLLIAFSPLRQRAGDAAAGTVVIAPALRDAEREEPAGE